MATCESKALNCQRHYLFLIVGPEYNPEGNFFCTLLFIVVGVDENTPILCKHSSVGAAFLIRLPLRFLQPFKQLIGAVIVEVDQGMLLGALVQY